MTITPVDENAEQSTDQTNEMPLSVSSFNTIEGDSNVIAEISPAKFDSLVKILSLLDKSHDSIMIQESMIVQQYKRGIMYADVNEVFDGKKIDLQILNPKKNVKLLKQFKSNTNVYIVNDDENSRYVLTNGEIKLFLPKQHDSTSTVVQIPDSDNAELLCSAEIDKNSAKTIDSLASDVNYIEYLIQNDELKAVHVPDTAIYILSDYLQDLQASKLDETNADLSLRSEVYLPVSADEFDVHLYKTTDGSYFSYTICDTGLVKISVYENLDLTTGGNLLL